MIGISYMTRVTTISNSYATRTTIPKNLTFASTDRAVERSAKISKNQPKNSNMQKHKGAVNLSV